MPSPTIDPNQIATIVNAVLVILGAIGFPVLLVIAVKGKRILSDLKDIFVNAVQASNDGKLTPDEITNIVNDAKDIVVQGLDIIKASTPTAPGVAPSTPSTSVATST